MAKKQIKKVVEEVVTPEPVEQIEEVEEVEEEDDEEDEMAQNMGIAYQVHNAFANIDINALIQLINDGQTDVYQGSKPFNQYLFEVLTSLLPYGSRIGDESLESLTNKLNALRQKIMVIDNEHTDVLNTILNFVSKQDEQYKGNYINFFVNDCYNAYDTGVDTTSCVKGIKERLFFALGQAGVGSENPLYEQISRILFPSETISNEQIYSFISKCIETNTNELSNLGDNNTEEVLRNKSSIIKECVKRKILESNSNIDISSLEERINQAIRDSQDMLGGKRKKKRKITKKNKNGSKKTKKHVKKMIAKKKHRSNKHINRSIKRRNKRVSNKRH